MKLSVREIQADDVEKIVDYFLQADAEFLKGMGADKSKLPQREEWIKKLEFEFEKSFENKEFYYIIWLIDKQPVGHSNIHKIEVGNKATMHLHLWKNDKRKNGLGLKFLNLSLPLYFENFKLKKLICEPSAENVAPNKVLKKIGFELVKTYDTTPGWINFHQTVNKYEFSKEKLEALKGI